MTGIMFRDGHGGHLYWIPCGDPADGLAQMAAAAFTYGKGWGHAASRAEFGTVTGDVFKKSADVPLPWQKGE